MADPLTLEQALAELNIQNIDEVLAQQDRDFWLSVPQRIRDEKAVIEQALAQGKTLVANSTSSAPVIHRSTCAHIRHQLDRDYAWEAMWELQRLESRPLERAAITFGRVEKMPDLRTPEEVEQLRTYRSCGSCGPDTSRQRKRIDEVGSLTTMGNVVPARIGRRYTTIENKDLGLLNSYEVTSDGFRFTFDTGVVEGEAETPLILMPKR